MVNRSIRDSLIGAWRLICYRARQTNGEVSYPFGQNLLGLLFYTQEGFMSVHVMNPGRPNYASGGLQLGTTEEMAAAAQGYVGYAGPFSVDEAAGSVTHHIKLSLSPSWVSIDQVRFVKLEGDSLELGAEPILINGLFQGPHTKWKRVNSKLVTTWPIGSQTER
jgi:lipocalin-like protein